MACSQPEEMGVPLSRWSCVEVAAKLVALQIVVSIATSTVWRWFKAEKIKPWRYHFWQHAIDPNFVALAVPVLRLYEWAVALLGQGIWVVCVDEKTSIQARKGVHPPTPSIAGQVVHVAPRYERKGALQLFAALSVGDGMVYGESHERKKFADFKGFLLNVLVPEAVRRGVRELRLIADNGPTHAPKQLESWLAEQQRVNEWSFTVQVLWLPKYASWLDQIEIWFSVLQRKVLTPNHFPSLENLRKRILDFIAHYNHSAKPIRWSYTVDQLIEKFAMN